MYQSCVRTKTLRTAAFTLTVVCTNSEINARMCVPPRQFHVWRTYISHCFCPLATLTGNEVKLQTLHNELFYKSIAPPPVGNIAINLQFIK